MPEYHDAASLSEAHDGIYVKAECCRSRDEYQSEGKIHKGNEGLWLKKSERKDIIFLGFLIKNVEAGG